MFNITSHEFKGPLGILLNMIEDEKLDITAIALSKIADQYIDYVKLSPEIDPEELADFLVIAAKLLWLKSKALLPYLEVDDEESVDDLEKQLKIYKEFADASLKILDILKQKNYLFISDIDLKKRRALFNLPIFTEPKNLSQAKMKETMLLVLRRLATEKPLDTKTIEETINLEDRINIIRQLIKKQASFTWQSLIKNQADKTEVIVNLLAILELVKQHELEFEQETLFSEIKILRSSSI
jgi:segregation and condensation protein A